MKPKFSQIKKSHTFLAAGLLTAAFVVAPSIQAADWTGANANWNSNGNPGWNGTGVPNSVGAVANHGVSTTSVTTQNVSGGVTVGTISLTNNSNNSWTITNTNGITLNQDGAGSGTATISNTNTSSSTGNSLILNSGTLTLADNLLISNTGASTSGSGSIRIGSVIAGTGNITIDNVPNNNATSSGSIRLAGANTFTGNVNLRSGITTFTNSSAFGNAANVITLGASGASALHASGNVTLANNWVVDAHDSENYQIYLGALSNNTATYSGTGTLNGDLFLYSEGSSAFRLTMSGVISGAGNLTAENGFITISQANTFTGITRATGAVVTLANTHALQNSTLDTANGDFGRNFNLGNAVTSLTLGGLIGTTNLADRFGDASGGIDPESSTYPNLTALTLNPGTGVTRTYDGAIANGANNMTLTKTGVGTQVLSGTNTYTGATTVTQGTLVVNGNISTSTTTVQTGATLGGSGTVGALTVNNGAIHTPGNSPGIQNTGNYSNAGTLAIEINGATAGTDYDQVNTTGTVSLSGLLTVTMGGSYTPAENALFFILANDGNDAISGTFSNASINGNTYTLGGKDFAISYFGNSTTNSFTGGNDVVLKAVVIPEPGAALLGSLGMLMLLRRRR